MPSPARTALISVHDKTGLDDFARALTAGGFEILSTGGTLAHLKNLGIPALAVEEYTGQPEILGGRVKTLHPMIFAGILARRDVAGDMETLARDGIRPIDVVAVSLYPFEETVARPDVTLAEAIEQIDIGGVSLIRAAAKNHAAVAVVSSPGQYDLLAPLLAGTATPAEADALRARLAREAFLETTMYDTAIADYLHEQSGDNADMTAEEDEGDFPELLETVADKLQDLRYGENPHQRAAFYADAFADDPTCIANADQLQGKELSYNNILDADSALEIARAFPESPACVVIKHNNPCGVARADTLVEAYKAARDCDPTSSFGGVVGFNRDVDADTAAEMEPLFLEAVVAPKFTDGALAILAKKKNLRLLETGPFAPARPQTMLRSVVGGILVQDRDLGTVTRADLKTAGAEQPDDDDIDGLLFAWRVAKFTKSNAIVYTSRNATIGIGAGQMSRIDSTNIAAVKAQRPIRGAYMASDAFFPFRDNIDRAADIGIRAIIQPGGSVRDEEVIAAANQHKIILLFTGMRHFRH